MEQFIRTNDDGEQELNYDLLDMAARINFQRYVENWAAGIEIDFADATDNAEKVETIDTTIAFQVDYGCGSIQTDGEIVIDQDTRQWMEELMARRLAAKYEVTL